MKRVLSCVAVGSLLLVAAACGSDDSSSSSSASAPATAAPAESSAPSDSTAPADSGAPSDSAAPDTGGDTGGSAADDAAAAASGVADALKPITSIGVTVPLTETPPEGKTVGWIGGNLQNVQPITTGFKAATDAIGWNLKIIDFDPGDPQTVNAAMQQAVDQNVDYIAISGTDIASFQQAADAAKDKGIPIIDMYSTNPATGADGNDIYAVISDAGATEKTAAQISDWVIADSGGTAHAVFVNLPEFPILQAATTGATANYTDNCQECTFDELDVTLSDLTGGTVPSALVSYLQTHSDVDYVTFAIGDLFGGVPEALATAGIADQVTLGGGSANVDQVQTLIDGESSVWAMLPREESAWHAVDAMARLSVGMDLDGVPSSLLTALWTQDNVPTPAHDYRGAEDFEGQFVELWGL